MIEDNPVRLIEDKANQLGIAMRSISISVDATDLHKNSERPSYFQAWIAVPDACLPAKGVGYRRSRHDDVDTKGLTVSTFASTSLWKLQGFTVGGFPKAIPESEFAVPSERSHLQSADARRNLTDAQETAQWLSGHSIWESVLESLGVSMATCSFGVCSICFAQLFVLPSPSILVL